MKVLVLFESCTGNTELAAEVVRRTLEGEGHTCSVRRFRDTGPGDLDGHDLYCFSTPIQSFAPLAPVYDYLKSMPRLEGRPAFILTTGAGWAGVGHRMIARRLRKRGMAVLGARLMPCPDNWPISRAIDRWFYDRVTFPRRSSLKKTRAFVREMVNKAYRHLDGIQVKQAPHILWPTPTLPFGLFAARGGLSRGFGTRTVDGDLCTRCGICVDACPVGAVTLQDLPVFDDSCVGCWACFNNCPESAILSSLCKPSSYYRGIKDPEKLL